MFTRTELELKSLRELRELCLTQYGIQPVGNPVSKEAYIVALLTFSVIACKQVREHTGLRTPSFAHVQELGAILESMNTPTPEQSALIKATLEGRKLEYPNRYEQEKLFALYRVKWYLDEATQLLGML